MRNWAILGLFIVFCAGADVPTTSPIPAASFEAPTDLADGSINRGFGGQPAAKGRSDRMADTMVDPFRAATPVQLGFGAGGIQCTSDDECSDFNDCTTESCDGNTFVCVYTFVSAGAACGNSLDDECTNPDTCDGAGVCLPNHAPDGTTCQTTETCLAGECNPPTHYVVALPEGTNVGSDAECAFAGGSTVYAAGNVIDASLVDHASVWESTDAGASFTLVELPEAATGPSGVKSITCDTGGICYAVGFDGATQQPAAWRRDGTGTWSSETIPLPGGATAGILMDGALELTTGDLMVAGWFVDGGGAQKAAYWTRFDATGTWSVSTLPDLGGNAMVLVLNLERDDGGLDIAGGVEDAGGTMVPAIWVEGPPASGLFTVEFPYLVPAGTSGIINAFEYDDMDRIWIAAGEMTLLDGSTRGVVWEIQSLNLYDERDLWVLPPQIGYTDSRANDLHNRGASRTIYGQSWSSLAIAGTSGPRPSTHWRDDGGGRTRGDGSTTLENLPPGCYAEREGAAHDPRERPGGPTRGRAIRLECPPPATAASGSATTHAAYAALTMPASYKYWKDPVSGNWSDTTKWVDAVGNPVGAPPGSGEEAFITVDGAYTVTLDVNPTVAGVTLGGGAGLQVLSVPATRTLSVSSHFVNTATLDVSSTLNVTNGGVVDLHQGTQNITGILNITGGETRIGPGTSNTGGGTISLKGTHTLAIDGSYTEQPAPAASLVFNEGSVTVQALGASATLTNDDELNFDCFDSISAGVTVVNNGTFGVGHAYNGNCTFAVNGPFQNPATGTLRLVHSSTGIGPQLTMALAQDLENDGLIEMSSVGFSYGYGFLTIGGGSGTLTNRGTIRSLVGVGGGRTINANFVNEGALTVDQPLTINNGGLVDLRVGSQDVPTTLTIAGGETRVGPGTSNTGGGIIAFSGACTLSIDGSYTEQPAPAASLDHVDGTVLITALGAAASLVNNDELSLQCWDSVAASVTIVNNGTFNVSGSDCTVLMNGPFVNPATGTLNLAGAMTGGYRPLTVAFAQDFENDGVVNLTSSGCCYGATIMSISGGAGMFTNRGELHAIGTSGDRVLDAALVNEGAFTVPHQLTIDTTGDIDLRNGTQDITGALTTRNARILVGPNPVTGGGTLTTWDGSLYGTGTLTLDITLERATAVSAGLPQDLAGGPAQRVGTLNIDGDFTLIDSASMHAQLAGETPGTDHDQINVTGSALLRGSLWVSLLNGHVPTPSGSVYRVLTYGSLFKGLQFLSGIYGLDICPDLNLVPVFGATELDLAATGTLTEACLCTLNPDFHVVDTSLPSALYASPYAHQLTASCGAEPYSWSVTGGALPDGVTLSPDGLLSGTPAQPGEYPVTVTAYDNVGAMTTAELSLTVLASPALPVIEATFGAPPMVIGREHEFQLLVRNLGEGDSRALLLTSFLEPWFHYVEASPTPTSVVSSTGVPDSLPQRTTIEWSVPPIPQGSFYLASYSVELDARVPIGFYVGWMAWVVPASDPTWMTQREAILARDAGCDLACIGDLIVEDTGCANDPLVCLIDRISSDADCAACYSSYPSNPSPTTIAGSFEGLLAERSGCCCKERACIDAYPRLCREDQTDEQCCTSLTGTLKENAEDCASSAPTGGTGSATGSLDPNDKQVTGGAYVRTDAPLQYTVRFENIGNADAQDVFVRDVLDANLDDTTLQILSPGGSYNGGSRLLQWGLFGINLPPGEGDSVSAVIQPVAGTPSGTQIFNDAEIQFESLTPIVTNQVVNTIDEVPPVCTMDVLPATSLPWINLSWSGSDAVGEIASYTVFVSVDGGPFDLLTPTSETNAVYVGEVGRTYGFLCAASDTAGNVEVQSPVAETTTTVVAATDATLPNLVVDAVRTPTCVPWQLITGQATDPDGGDAISGVDNVFLNVAPAVFDRTTGQFVRAAALVPGLNDIVIKAVDYAGNENLAFAQIDLDDVPPDVTCPGETNVISEDGVSAPLPGVTGSVAATDDCGFAPSLSQDPPAGTVVGLGAQLVTVTATDLAGNVNQCIAQVNVTPAPPGGDPTGVGRKNRYFTIVPGNAGAQTAIRVIPRVLPGFESAEGSILWVGAPQQYPEEDSSQPGRTFTGAALSCQPVFQWWDPVGEVHVFGAEVIPEAVYDVQTIFQAAGSLVDETNYSLPLVVTTGVWGDIVPLYEGDDPGAPQPDFNDIASVVSKFIGDPAAPIKARAQLQPNTAIPLRAISFKDIADAVSAFVGDPYSYSGPCTCPSSVTCFATPCTGDLQCGDGFCIDGGCTDACGRCTP